MTSDLRSEEPVQVVSLTWKNILRTLETHGSERDHSRLVESWFEYEGELLWVLKFRRDNKGVWKATTKDENGEVSDYVLSTVVARSASPLVVPSKTMAERTVDNRLWTDDILTTAHAFDIEEAQRNAENLLREEQLRRQEEADKERIRAERERLRIERSERLAHVERVFLLARDQLISCSLGSIGEDIDRLMPLTPNWSELLLDCNSDESETTRIDEVGGYVHELRLENYGDLMAYAKISSNFRKLKEPQCSIAIGRSLDARGFDGIVPSYLGALMDLELYDHAGALGRKYWEAIESIEKPKFFISAYLRVLRALGAADQMRIVEDWANRKGLDIGYLHRSGSLPTQLRKRKRDLLVELYG